MSAREGGFVEDHELSALKPLSSAVEHFPPLRSVLGLDSEFFAEYPVILGPTWCQPQFEHGYDIADSGSAGQILNLMRFVTPMNLLGLPVACVPTGTANGLPLGVQLIGDRFREDLCLDAAEAIEQRLGRITPIDPPR